MSLSLLKKLPKEIWEHISIFTDYQTYQRLRCCCRMLQKLLPSVKRSVYFSDYSSMLEITRLQDWGLQDPFEQLENEYWWNHFMASTVFLDAKRIGFQKKVHLDLHPSSLTQSQYLYLCRNKMVLEVARVVSAVLKTPRKSYNHIDITAANTSSYLSCTFSLPLAIFANDSDLVKLILATTDISPADFPFRLACSEGFSDIVKVLLTDNRVNPTVNRNSPICDAADNGHVKVVRLLLQDGRADPAADDNSPIRFAADQGHVEIVQLLLQDPRVDPSDDGNSAFLLACAHGHVDIVLLFLKDTRVDPAANDSEAFIGAASEGHTEVVRLLLLDGRSDPTAQGNDAFVKCSLREHHDVLKLLLADDRVIDYINKFPYIE